MCILGKKRTISKVAGKPAVTAYRVFVEKPEMIWSERKCAHVSVKRYSSCYFLSHYSYDRNNWLTASVGARSARILRNEEGFWSFKERKRAAAFLRKMSTAQYDKTFVLVEVQASGFRVNYADGYRSQYLMITKILARKNGRNDRRR